VEDLASAHIKACEYLSKGESLKCNLGTGHGYSVKEIIQTAEKITGKNIPIIEEGRRAGDPASLVAKSDLAKEKLGWMPVNSNIKNILETAWQWEQKRLF